MENKLLCPLKPTMDNNPLSRECDGEKCAWSCWGNCAMLSLVFTGNDIVNELVEIRRKL